MMKFASLLRRLWRHLWCDERTSHRWLTDAAAERLRQRIEASEAHHRGEIRVCVEASLPLGWLWPMPDDAEISARVRSRALEWFGRLRVWDTEHNSGVLIYLLLAERAIEIVADRALAQRVPRAQWEAVMAQWQGNLRRAAPEEALAQAIDALHAWLCQYFRVDVRSTNSNELPNAVVRT